MGYRMAYAMQYSIVSAARLIEPKDHTMITETLALSMYMFSTALIVLHFVVSIQE